MLTRLHRGSLGARQGWGRATFLLYLSRGIEWSLQAFARARAVINFLMRATSTLERTNGEQRALRKFSASWNHIVLRQVI